MEVCLNQKGYLSTSKTSYLKAGKVRSDATQSSKKAPEGEDASDTKHKAIMHSLTNVKDRLVFVTWCEEARDLMVEKRA